MKRKCIQPVFALLLVVSGYSQTSYTFSGKPVYEIDARRNNISLGIIEIELFPELAPLHVRNFDSLVAHKFYDTIAFHRVVPGFVIQGGDPNSRHGPTSTWGYGQPGQPTVPAEFSNLKHVRGILSAARKGNDINSATSQFFICVVNTPQLDGQYSIYGKVRKGMDVVDTIVNAPRNSSDRPLQKIEMFVTRVSTDETVMGSPLVIAPSYGKRDMQTSVVLKWTAVPGAMYYQVQVTADSEFLSEIDSNTVFATQLTKNQLMDSTIYYWRVRAFDGNTYGQFVYGKFHTIGETTGLDSHLAGNETFIYPNPSSGVFLVKGLRADSEIEVYNMHGQHIGTYAKAGEEIELDLKHVSPGVYFYTIRNHEGHYARGKLVFTE
jgi:peptidyl-prolyl cis-trans isomerase B (cyclophilin B)